LNSFAGVRIARRVIACKAMTAVLVMSAARAPLVAHEADGERMMKIRRARVFKRGRVE